jgi:DNA repair protein RadD
MSDGSSKKVEELKQGDFLLSYDNYTKKNVSNEISNVIRTSINPKPMIEFEHEGELIKTTYDHPFFNGERFYPLYQLVWGKMEASQRARLKLLCKQYGQTFNHEKKRGLLSCCNESCPRCMRVLENSDGRKDNKNTQNSSRELAGESFESSRSKPYKRDERRQQSGKYRMVYGEVQCVDWEKDREHKSADTSEELTAWRKKEKGNKEVLLRKNNTSKTIREKKAVRLSSNEVPAGEKKYTLENSNRNIVVKEAEPYYSICMRRSPHTYYIGRRGNFLTHNSGKSLVIAYVARCVQKNVLILQPSLEILKQNKEKLLQYVDKSEVGVFSASAGEKTINKYTFAMIGSVYKKPELFKDFGLILCDEAHAINNKKDNSMYNSFLKDIGKPTCIGFTATPYRVYPTYFYNEVGQLYQTNSVKIITRTRPQFFDKITYNINYADLVEQGYLSPIQYVDKSLVQQSELQVNKSGTDFDLPSFELKVEAVESEVIASLTEAKSKFKHILVFCSSLRQAERLSEQFEGSEWVSGETDKKTRERVISGFKEGKIQMVFNVGVLTTGFDFPALDCIALLRPTRSPALYYQMLGRGVRKAEGKDFCTVIDFTNTVERIGPIESLKLDKVEGKWNLVSKTMPTGWNGVELYRFAIEDR